MKHELTRRLVLYFSVTLLVFAMLIGSLFYVLFERYTAELHIEDLRQRAVSIAATMSAMPDYAAWQQRRAQQSAGESRPEPEHRGSMHGMMHGNHSGNMDGGDRCRYQANTINENSEAATGSSFASYLRLLNDIAQSEVWIVDEKARTIDLYGQETASAYQELPDGAEQLIETVFGNEAGVSQEFSPLLGTPSITVGAPIHDKNGQVIAALLLHRTLQDMEKAERGGFLLLAACLAAAFLLSIILSLLLARRFIRPLQRMEQTAAALAEGRYETRTGVKQQDEIGSLAASLDVLAARLAAAAQESARLDQMRRDFITSVSHELRTPITVLRGSLEALDAGLVTGEKEQQEYRQQMMATTLHMQRLVNDLLELSRLQNPDFSIEKAPMNLSDALHDAVHALRRLAEPESIRITLPEPLPPLACFGDYGRLRQLFMVILDNAVKFSPAGAAIEVTLQITGRHWRITIHDHGCGIAADELPHIFDRFRRTKAAANPNGTGLGLAIAREIAGRHAIQLHAESVPGQGTSFIFEGTISQQEASSID